MDNMHSTGATTVIPVLRDDGTVYFHYSTKPISERLCEWTVAFLWLLVIAVIAGTLFWY